MLYNITTSVNYNDNVSYRKCLRDVFGMTETATHHCPDAAVGAQDVDPETVDEYFYDEPQFKKVIEDVYRNTIDEVDFEELYETAAGFMFSNDLETGLTVLFAYDYFCWFHPLLVKYLSQEPYKNEYRQLELRLNCDSRKKY